MTPLVYHLEATVVRSTLAWTASWHVRNWTDRPPLNVTDAPALANDSLASNHSLPLSPLPPWHAAIVASILAVMILAMVIGNIFVILAILLERDLQRPQYYLILSLGFADLMVGLVAGPLATVYEVQRKWRLGVPLCDFWISMDVLACTSSILHLVAIALDRYWSITDIVYSQGRTPKRIGLMLLVVWVISLLISVAPILGWKDAEFEDRVLVENECLISQDLGYQVFSTITAFYGPLILIILVYWKIFQAARKRIRKGNQKRKAAARTLDQHSNKDKDKDGTSASPPPFRPRPSLPATPLTAHNSTPNVGSRAALLPQNNADEVEAEPSTTNHTKNVGNGEVEKDEETELGEDIRVLRQQKRTAKESAEAKRERRAWRTLAIITGTFVGCWLPFFILAIARPICAAQSNDNCNIDHSMQSVFLWLGYLNSAINPIIYTIFSPDFRQAFTKIARRICFML